MLKISNVLDIGAIQNTTLRRRAEKAHCAKSQEFLASVNGEEAGLLSYEHWSAQESGFIYELFVLPAFRRQGIGNSLLLYAESLAMELGSQFIRLKPYSLEPEQDQEQLVAWYAKSGYRQMLGDLEHMEKSLFA
jgi:ribosomal protein S18 acetylase RimI-like enzyme